MTEPGSSKKPSEEMLAAAQLLLHEIGEYTGCDHGPDGSRLYGCGLCAIKWHTAMYDQAAQQVLFHHGMLKKLRILQAAEAERARASEPEAR